MYAEDTINYIYIYASVCLLFSWNIQFRSVKISDFFTPYFKKCDFFDR